MLIFVQEVKKFPAWYGTRRVISVFSRGALDLVLFQMNQSTF
jgi:hypothetical protein